MRIWVNFSTSLIIVVVCASLTFEWLLFFRHYGVNVLVFPVFLLAAAMGGWLKGKIPQRLLRLAAWMVAGFPFLFALAMAWEVVNLPATDHPRGWAGIALLFCLALAVFAAYEALLYLFRLLKGLIVQPPQSFMAWCRRLCGGAVLTMVTVGGSVGFASWMAYDAVRHCSFYDGALDATAPAMREHLDALTEGTFTGFSQIDRYVKIFTDSVFWELDSVKREKAEAAASDARKEFLLLHTQYGGCEMLDEEKYAWWLERMSAERDWPEAHYLLALRHGYGGFVDGVLNDTGGEWWINGGDEYRAPVANSHGNGENLDLEKSFALLQRAARGGYRHAQWVLGRVYATGFWGKDDALAVGVDYGKSTAWLERYVDKNQDVGMGAFYTLGYRYRYGERYGLQPDERKATAYLSTEGNDSGKKAFEATLELALLTYERQGEAQHNKELAHSLLESADREFARLIWLANGLAGFLSLEEGTVAQIKAALEEKNRRLKEVRSAIGYHGDGRAAAINLPIVRNCQFAIMRKFHAFYEIPYFLCADEALVLSELVDFAPHLFVRRAPY